METSKQNQRRADETARPIVKMTPKTQTVRVRKRLQRTPTCRECDKSLETELVNAPTGRSKRPPTLYDPLLRRGHEVHWDFSSPGMRAVQAVPNQDGRCAGASRHLVGRLRRAVRAASSPAVFSKACRVLVLGAQRGVGVVHHNQWHTTRSERAEPLDPTRAGTGRPQCGGRLRPGVLAVPVLPVFLRLLLRRP